MGTYRWKPFTLLVSAEEVEKEVLKIEAKYDASVGGYMAGDVFEVTGQNEEGYCFIDNEGHERYRCKDEFTVLDETPSPIRTVTRREIVPGVYGKVFINSYDKEANTVWINVKEDFGCVEFNAEELRETAHILNQIAEFLEENGK